MLAGVYFLPCPESFEGLLDPSIEVLLETWIMPIVAIVGGISLALYAVGVFGYSEKYWKWYKRFLILDLILFLYIIVGMVVIFCI